MTTKFTVAALILILSASFVPPNESEIRDNNSGPSAKQSFDRWLENGGQSSDNRRKDYRDLQAFLESQSVAEVVPVWQLLRTDADYAERCDLPYFGIPPRELWPAIVPTLKLVRDQVIPVVGSVEINSSWRSHAVNECVNGAKHSRHLSFSAVDLVTSAQADKEQLFRDLCQMHQQQGRTSNMGLGVYYSPEKPALNVDGRFHIDASGFRTWGYDYTASSSACVFL